MAVQECKECGLVTAGDWRKTLALLTAIFVCISHIKECERLAHAHEQDVSAKHSLRVSWMPKA